MTDQTPSPQSVVVRRADLEEVRDLLMERIYGSAARSPGHNARLAVEAMLAAAPAPSSLAGGISREQVVAIVRQFASPSWCSVDRLVDTLLAALSPEAPAREGVVMAATDVPMWADGIATDGENVAMAQKAETDHGGHYRAVDGGNGGLDWEPTHFISLDALTPRHEAPADDGPVFHMNLSSHEDNEAWLESARRVAAKHEAPAEGAGDTEPEGMTEDERGRWRAGREDWREDDWEDHCGKHGCSECSGEIPMTRPRSSAPEAREGDQPVDGDWQSIAMWMGFAASVIKSGEPWTDQCQREFDEAKAAYGRLSAHPAAPSADKLREDGK